MLRLVQKMGFLNKTSLKQYLHLQIRKNSSGTHTSWRLGVKPQYIIMPDVPSKIDLLKEVQLQPSETYGAELFDYVSRLCMEAEVAISDHCNELEDVTFDSVVKPVEEMFSDIDKTINMAKCTISMQNRPALNVVIHSLLQKHRQVKAERFSNEHLYKACLTLSKQKQSLKPADQIYLDFFLRNFHYYGMHLNSKKRIELSDLRLDLDHEQRLYTSQVEYANSNIKLMLSEKDWSPTTPESLLRALAVPRSFGSRQLAPEGHDDSSGDVPRVVRGPFVVTLNNPQQLHSVYSHCSNATFRQSLWKARVMRCGDMSFAETGGSTKLLLYTIRSARTRMARLLGFESWGHWYCAQRCHAGSLPAVVAELESTRTHILPEAFRQWSELNAFATEHLQLPALYVWDIAYAMQQFNEYQKQKSSGATTHSGCALSVPSEAVLSSVVQLCELLFSVRIVVSEQPSGADGVMHCLTVLDGTETVMCIHVQLWGADNNVLLHHFDARSPHDGVVRPATWVRMAWPPDTQEVEHSQMAHLFASVVCALQFGLASRTVPYFELAAVTDADVVNSASLAHTVEGNTTLYSLMNYVWRSRHQVGVSDHMWHLRQYLLGYQAALELEMTVTEAEQLEVQTNIWKNWFDVGTDSNTLAVTMKPWKYDQWSCSDINLFGVSCDRAVLPNLSNILTGSMLKRLAPPFLTRDDDQLRQVGRRFRETFFSYGVCRPSEEVFRTFLDVKK